MLRAPAAPLRRAGWLALAASLSFAPQAYAQTSEELQRARNDFRQAITLQAAGDYAGALAKLQAVSAVRMTPQVRFNIAVCEKNLGKLVAALGNFTLSQSEALDQDLTEIAQMAEEHIDDIQARMPKLTIVRGEGAEAATISLDGVDLGAAVLGSEMNVDPGPHSIVAKVDGETSFSRTVEMAEHGIERVVVTIESAAPAIVEKPKSEPLALEIEPSGWSKKHTAFTALGVGGAGAVAGIVFLVLRSGTISDLDAVCQDMRCPASAESTADKGKLYTGLAGASLAVGAVGLGLGSYFLFGDSSSSSESDGLDVASPSNRRGVSLGFGSSGASAGASLLGRF